MPAFDVVTASTGTVLKSGAYVIGQPAGNKLWTLGSPVPGGSVSVFADTRSTKDIAIQGGSSLHTFMGSTNNKATISTGVGGVKLLFEAISTSEWALTTHRGSAFSTKSVVTLAATTKVA